MPERCYLGCPPGNPVHIFPNPDKDLNRFKTWVDRIGETLNTPEDYQRLRFKRLCSRHFLEKYRNRFNRLNVLAVPSLHLCKNKPAFGFIAPSKDNSNIENVDPKPNVLCPTIFEKSTSELETRGPDNSNIENVDPKPNTFHPTILENLTNPSRALIEGNTTEMAGQKALINAYLFSVSTSNAVFVDHSYSCVSKRKFVKGVQKKMPGYSYTQLKPMQMQVKALKSEIIRLRKKAKTLKSRLSNAEKLSMEISFQKVVKNMKVPAQLFMHMQLQSTKKSKGRRFSIKEKVLCLSLYKRSPKCYRLLYKYFSLPSAKSMKRLLSQIKLSPGINPIIFKKIKNLLDSKDTDYRLCSLMFDEMSITPQISYNSSKDEFEGFANNKSNKFADHVIVFMVKGLKNNFKQPIAYYFTNSLNKSELKNLLKTVVSHAQESGLVIVNTVCDQSTVNVGAITELVNETKANFLRRGKTWRNEIFRINGQDIIPLYDVPHLIKGVRNNLLTKDMSYTVNNVTKIVKWEYYQKIYAADKSYGELRLLNKITEEHVNPEKINKMRVKHATQIFSHSVAVVAEHLTARGDLPQECRQVIDITLLLDDLFDSLNVSSFNIPNGKVYRGPVKNKSPHHKLWKKAKKVLKTVKYIVKKKTDNKIQITETVVPSLTNLIKTINGMEALWEVLTTKYGFDAVLTRNFNQDPIENFFGNIRSYGARNVAPNTTSFEGAFKALLLNNYNSPHSTRANCEEDENSCLQTLDFFLTEKVDEITPNVSAETELHFNSELCIYNTQKDAGQRNYVCGWVLTKCMKNVVKSCKKCKETILDSEHNSENNRFIKAKEYSNKEWLCYPSKAVEKCFHDLQNICTSLLKDGVQKKKIRKTIELYADVFVDYPFNCDVHKVELQNFFFKTTVNIVIYSWCRSVNRILNGKIDYNGDDVIKTQARIYYVKHRKYKNRK